MKAKVYNPSQPGDLIKELLQYRKSGEVLDVGAGRYGNNAFFMAGHGFRVTATEHYDKLYLELANLNSKAEDTIELVEAGILDYDSDHAFDIVICAGVLHFMKSKAEVQKAVGKLQDWTRPGGLCLVTVFTDKNPAGSKPYLFAENELKSYFNGWHILKHESAASTYKDEPTNTIVKYYSERLIAERLP